MTVTEIRRVVEVQAKINEDDDFLLLPYRLISTILTGARDLGKPQKTSTPSDTKADSSPPSQNVSESVH